MKILDFCFKINYRFMSSIFVNLLKKLTCLLIMNLLAGCTYFNMLVHQSPKVEDMKIFSNRSISPSNSPFHFNYSSKYLPYLDTVKLYNPYTKQESILDTLLYQDKTSALIIYINNKIVCEKYFRGREVSKTSCVFSISKSILSALVGVAISNRNIQSIDQRITDFIPQLKDNSNFNQITIKQLLQMSSGLDWRKNKAFDDDGKFYYTSNIRRLIVRHKQSKPPGSMWEYKNIDSELLGWVIENATGSTISELVQKYLWEPMGAEFNAYWSLDTKNGVEKASSSFNACARDLLKFGCIYLNNGKFNGKQIVPQSWITSIFDIPASPNQQPSLKHNFLWWIPNDGSDREIVADGYLGQRLTINPKYNIVIVKLGEANSNTNLDKVLRYIINSEAAPRPFASALGRLRWQLIKPPGRYSAFAARY
jgi:CubicO group peptidase (beta-lactamase class C family)